MFAAFHNQSPLITMPSPNRRLWNAVSLKFCFTATLLSNCSDIKNGKKIVEESSEVQERFLLIEVRKQEFFQLKGIQLLNFLPSSLWNYLLLQICSEDRIILRGSIFFSKTTFFTIFRRENSLNWETKTNNNNKKKNKKKLFTSHKYPDCNASCFEIKQKVNYRSIKKQ